MLAGATPPTGGMTFRLGFVSLLTRHVPAPRRGPRILMYLSWTKSLKPRQSAGGTPSALRVVPVLREGGMSLSAPAGGPQACTSALARSWCATFLCEAVQVVEAQARRRKV